MTNELRSLRVVLVALLACLLAGCSLTGPGRPEPSPSLMDKATVQSLMLHHLDDKCGETFICDTLLESPAHSPLEAPRVFTMRAYASGSTMRDTGFTAQWRQPDTGSAIDDDYLLVKMRSQFAPAIDASLASVFPQYLATYGLNPVTSESLYALPGTIPVGGFMSWARNEATLMVTAGVPLAAGLARDDIDARVAPLVQSRDGLGASGVALQVTAGTPEVFTAWANWCGAPDGHETRGGSWCSFTDPVGTTGQMLFSANYYWDAG